MTTNTTTQNVVKVDFIGAEYVGNGLGGFDKKGYKGYNGSKATGKKGNGGDGGDGGDGGAGPGGNKGAGDGKGSLGVAGASGGGKNGGNGEGNEEGPKPGSKLTDEQIRKIMMEDPEAAKFLDGILPGQEQKFESVVVS